MRLVSLVPSVTESLLHWNLDVVGCTRFCEQPLITHVGGTKDPQIDAIVALQPDLVVLDREENRREDADALRAAGVPIHITHVTSVDDVEPMLDHLAAAVGFQRHAHVADEARVSPFAPRVSAFVPIWRRPWMTIARSTYAANLLNTLGVDTLPSGTESVYPTVELEEVAALRPALVLLPSEPYPFAQRHVAAIARSFGHSRIVLVDGQDLFWWGVRTPMAIERLRGVLREAMSLG
jgi:ABC-type hemin transport system substrate-binding protein